MIYAVIHDCRLLGLYRDRDAAKQAAAKAATEVVKCTAFRWLYQEGEPERCEVIYQPARNRRWVHTGYFVDAAELP